VTLLRNNHRSKNWTANSYAHHHHILLQLRTVEHFAHIFGCSLPPPPNWSVPPSASTQVALFKKFKLSPEHRVATALSPALLLHPELSRKAGVWLRPPYPKRLESAVILTGKRLRALSNTSIHSFPSHLFFV